ncbi:hypothetical protein PGT21_035021 [Puccinia graminis f. sp. tritici]|uniref:Uncharacterized protein n=1 Tax=Puccinia graminis f. sp. tritici TaxID=56615 RepID=A0A5B0N667_PUCGR|nr:hypothetical protein PGTUg99_022538 [Puccinia graminis f. sp. tritici]KAA1084741.1 hypothetical protein PGT21_035021 [Puccinia graminis f. sp. tritici]
MAWVVTRERSPGDPGQDSGTAVPKIIVPGVMQIREAPAHTTTDNGSSWSRATTQHSDQAYPHIIESRSESIKYRLLRTNQFSTGD